MINTVEHYIIIIIMNIPSYYIIFLIFFQGLTLFLINTIYIHLINSY